MLTACHLIYRVPSTLLSDKTLLIVPCPNKPFFYLSSKISGCLSFVHILDKGRNKLNSQAVKRVF